MRNSRDLLPRIGTALAVTVLLVLAGLLGIRLLPRSTASAFAASAPPAANVPNPSPCNLAELAIPCWSCPHAQQWPLRFRTDLDMLAPLGTGAINAATWFATFAKPNGPRLAEAEAAMARRVDRDAFGDILPPNDPLLIEAAPWCDQATMRYYPDVFTVQGSDTQVPNLLLQLTFARSWLARGHDAASFDDAMADFRRVIRLGRLLRQDDVVLINDLVGLACIRTGAEAIYDRARKDGRTDLALLAALVAGEAPPQKLLSGARMTGVEVGPYARKASDGSVTLELPEARFEAIRTMATTSPDRRFRWEAVSGLRLVARLAPEPIRTKAQATLEQLAHGDDPVLAANARWSLTAPIGGQSLKSLLESEK